MSRKSSRRSFDACEKEFKECMKAQEACRLPKRQDKNEVNLLVRGRASQVSPEPKEVGVLFREAEG